MIKNSTPKNFKHFSDDYLSIMGDPTDKKETEMGPSDYVIRNLLNYSKALIAVKDKSNKKVSLLLMN